MSESIRNTTSEEDKKRLRKIKILPDRVKVVLTQGAIKSPVGVLTQFHRDLFLYGMWEALLYVEGYEREFYYAEGTAKKAVEAALQ
jgi:hypothetical protein